MDGHLDSEKTTLNIEHETIGAGGKTVSFDEVITR